uniref:OmpA family protein n=1 Tax=Parerythrobacter lutipelagi TaxID=1964208 RepID=UPI0019587786|nr:OmpA family protein [Parerythrobacter lutipelagi]
MHIKLNRRLALPMMAALALGIPAGVSAQDDTVYEEQVMTTVYGSVPGDLSGMPEGPEIEGMIAQRNGNRIEVVSPGGARTVVHVSTATQIKSSGGFLGLSKASLDSSSLLNGLPVKIETVQWEDGLVASEIDLKSKDLKTAAMIANGTQQGFAEQTAATDALRGRVANIDEYNIKGTTNVYFDTGKYNLSGEARNELCSAAQQANAMDNALLLVVGYTDSTGSYEINQELSEKRAERVVNYLQQQCGWKPYRMLTPTGMAESDPAADNSTAYGKAQNRRVAVNILVSKAVDGM